MAAPMNETPASAVPEKPSGKTPGGKTSLSGRVLKMMSIFSGVQVVYILCSIVRTKLVAIWLGPAGVGLFGIYNSVIETAGTLTQMGTGTGVIRALAKSPRQHLPLLVAVTRRWAWALGLAGALLTIVLSPLLSEFTFGDSNHTLGFILLSVTILLISLSNNEAAVFQGMKRYASLAKSSVVGAVAGLLISIPMYYFWGMDSIIPSLIAYVVVTWLCLGLYRQRVGRPDHTPGVRETFNIGKEFALLGLFMTITAFASNAIAYIFISYLNRTGGTETAGLYQAGFTLVNRYTGLILGAVGMEYLPRLSEVSSSRRRTEMFISHETTLLILIMFPVVTLFIAADELIVRFLYDHTFLTILPFITWAIVGTILRAWSWCLAFTILARGDGLCYLVTELLSTIVAIALNILLYNACGIIGLGYAYTLWYLFYLAEVWVVCRLRYNLRLPRPTVIFSTVIMLTVTAMAVAKSLGGWMVCIPFLLLSAIVFIYGMKKMLGKNSGSSLKKFVKPAKKG